METIKISRRKVLDKKLIHKASTEVMYKVLLIFPISMIIFAFMISTPAQLATGLFNIVQADGTLVTDYFLVGNIGATFLNVGIIILGNVILLKRLDLRPNGAIISALFLVMGFSFLGKNIFNILPIYLGGYIYCKYHKIHYRNIVVMNMVSTSLSPLVSVLALNFSGGIISSILFATIIGALIGFIMPSIAAHMVPAHAGYNLYNMGFAAGLMGIVVYAIISAFGYTTTNGTEVFTQWNESVYYYFLILFILLIVIGYILNDKSFKGFKQIFKYSGKLVTDIVKHVGFGLTLVNMGVLGLMSLMYIRLMGAPLNGSVIASMLTVVGYGAFGKHLKNTIPIILGVTLMSFIVPLDIAVTVVVTSALFGTSLAPIAGEFGAVLGILVGMVHLLVVTSIGGFHGGIMLYNNGLSTGLIATLCIPMLDAFKREEADET